MRKIPPLFAVIMILCISGWSQITENTNTPKQYERFELTLNLDHQSFSAAEKALIISKNAYDKNSIILEAQFTDPSGNTVTVNGFMYEDFTVTNTPQSSAICNISGNSIRDFPHIDEQTLTEPAGGPKLNWKVRFAPQQMGTWTYNLNFVFPFSSSASIPAGSGSFQCISGSNKGFVRMVNNVLRYSSDQSGFIPLGLNLVTWSEWDCAHQGSNFYDVYFDRLADEGGNFCRIFIDHKTTLTLNGPKNHFENRVYYDEFRQKGAYQLDKIIEKAEQRGIKIQICLNYMTLNPGAWSYNAYNSNCRLTQTTNCAYKGHCTKPEDLLDRPIALDVQVDLMKYIVDRWGYSTSVFSWEMLNEADLVTNDIAKLGVPPNGLYNALVRVTPKMVSWQSTLMSAARNHDIYDHMVTTSFGNKDLSPCTQHFGNPPSWNDNVNSFRNSIAALADYFAFSFYTSPGSKTAPGTHGDYSVPSWPMRDEKVKMYDIVGTLRTYLPNKPLMIAEHGVNYHYNELSSAIFSYNFHANFDPGALQQHSTLWSSVLSGFMGGQLHWDKEPFIVRSNPNNPSSDHMKVFKPVSEFIKEIETLDFSVQTANHYKDQYLSNYYLADSKRNKVFGWTQSEAFAFHNLIGDYYHGGQGSGNGTFSAADPYLTSGLNPSHKPTWSTDINHRTIKVNVPVSGTYTVEWYDTYTGLPTRHNIIEEYVTCGNELNLIIPTQIMDSEYGDVAYIASHKGFGEDVANQTSIISPVVNLNQEFHGNSQSGLFYTDQATGKFGRSSVGNSGWQQTLINISAPPIYANTGFYADNSADKSIYYCGIDNGVKNFYRLYQNNGSWQYQQLTNKTNLSISGTTNIKKRGNQFYFTRTDGKIAALYPCNQPFWCVNWLTPNAPTVIEDCDIDVASTSPVNIYYAGKTASLIKNIYKIHYSSGWQNQQITNSSNLFIRAGSNVGVWQSNSIGFYIRQDGLINAFYNCGQPYWCVDWLTTPGSITVKAGTNLLVPDDADLVFFIGDDDHIYQLYWETTWKTKRISTDNCFGGVKANSSLFYFDNTLFYVGAVDGKTHALQKTDPNQQLKSSGGQPFFQDYSALTTVELEEEQHDLNLYPNPSNGTFTIEFTTQSYESPIQVTLSSMTGQVLYDELHTLENGNTLDFHMKDLPKGVYHVKINVEDTTDLNWVRKVVIE
ncbi:T9SS type A sorting domain-containing protein [bacterium SCSIO 12741]|nr:T9SS type A sorting domain-containing protein [bacterium SCSIO 12741]